MIFCHCDRGCIGFIKRKGSQDKQFFFRVYLCAVSVSHCIGTEPTRSCVLKENSVLVMTTRQPASLTCDMTSHVYLLFPAQVLAMICDLAAILPTNDQMSDRHSWINTLSHNVSSYSRLKPCWCQSVNFYWGGGLWVGAQEGRFQSIP